MRTRPQASREPRRGAPTRTRRQLGRGSTSEPQQLGYHFLCRPGDRGPVRTGPRKVRTPQGRTLGKPQAAKANGKWHRKETASDGSRETSKVRVKRWGKSPPAPW